jgi:hypothetical protein
MRKSLAMAFLAALFLANTASAAPITFDLQYSGASFGNSATGVGTITFDGTVVPGLGSFGNVSEATLGITAFSITISGASSGNGTFGLADVDNWIWAVSAPLNYSVDLVGQAGFNDFNWCASGFVGCVPPAPGGIGPFTISTNAETGDRLRLTSMEAATVPEPATLSLLGTGLAWVVRRRARARRNTTAVS